MNKGVALKALGKPAEALACYQFALRLNPKDVHAWTNKGNALFSLKRYAEALAAYDSALSLDSSLSLAWLNKGICSARSLDLKKLCNATARPSRPARNSHRPGFSEAPLWSIPFMNIARPFLIWKKRIASA